MEYYEYSLSCEFVDPRDPSFYVVRKFRKYKPYFYPTEIDDDVRKNYGFNDAMRPNGHLPMRSGHRIEHKVLIAGDYLLIDTEDYGLIWVRYFQIHPFEYKNEYNVSKLYLPAYTTTIVRDKYSEHIYVRINRDDPVMEYNKQVHINIGWCDYNKYIIRTDAVYPNKNDIFRIDYTQINDISRYIDILPTETSEFIKLDILDKKINQPYREYSSIQRTKPNKYADVPRYKTIIENQYLYDMHFLWCCDYDYTAQTFRQISLTDYPVINKNHNVVLNDDVWCLIKEFMGISNYSYSSDIRVKSFNRKQMLSLCRKSMRGMVAYGKRYTNHYGIAVLLKDLEYDSFIQKIPDKKKKLLVQSVIDECVD